MKKALIFIWLIVSLSYVHAQYSKYQLEITGTDFITNPLFDSNDVLIFGTGLGMTRDQVKRKLLSTPGISVQTDLEHGTSDYRLYVFYRPAKEMKPLCILYLIWENNRSELSRITLFNHFARFVEVNSKWLLTTNEFEPYTDDMIDMLGAPDTSIITADIPEYGIIHTTWYYHQKGLEVTLKTHQGKNSIVLALVPKKR
jgi:hypothetical protein